MKNKFDIIPLSSYPALLLKKEHERILVIADLHVGWEVSLAEQGVHIPSQTPKMLRKLETIIGLFKPQVLIVLGDVKHTIAKIEIEEWRDVPDLFERLLRRVSDVKVVLGNHDGNLEPLLPEDVEIIGPRGLKIGNIGLFHGHTWPKLEMMSSETIILGHLHPVVSFRDPTGYRITRRIWVRAKCDGVELTKLIMRRSGVKSNMDPESYMKKQYDQSINISSIIIMPSFNEFLGGQPVNMPKVGREKKFSEFIGPVLRSGCVDLEGAETYLLDGTFLGKIGQIKALS